MLGPCSLAMADLPPPIHPVPDPALCSAWSAWSLSPGRSGHIARVVGSSSSSTELSVLYPVCYTCLGGTSCSTYACPSPSQHFTATRCSSCDSFLVLPTSRCSGCASCWHPKVPHHNQPPPPCTSGLRVRAHRTRCLRWEMLPTCVSQQPVSSLSSASLSGLSIPGISAADKPNLQNMKDFRSI